MPAPGECCALILAGGAGTRMGGQDKGLQPWRGVPLAAAVAARMTAAGLPVLISANRNLEQYRAFGYPVVPDLRSGYAGPLAAIEAGLAAAPSPWLLTLPCDCPLFPDDLLARLWSAVRRAAADPLQTPPRAAQVRCGPHRHPVFALAHRSLATPLTRFLDDGGRRVSDWWQAVGALGVDFGLAAEPRFANANTPEELASMAAAAGQDEVQRCSS